MIMPKGYLFSTAEAAIKKAGRKDLALIYSTAEANMAGVFTTNKIKASPVRLDLKNVRSGRGQAIIANSGNANACTGRQGMRDAGEMARLTSRRLGIRTPLVYVCSTGVIGVPMPMDRIRKVIPGMMDNLGSSTLEDVAYAIMTTDTFPKIAVRNVKIGSKIGRIAGVCKGSGMICPQMATMLCFIMTDIAVDQRTLERAVTDTVRKTFNRITVDGDMSTNDTVLIMANGLLGNLPVTEKSASHTAFRKSLDEVAYELSRLLARDGEGATKLIEIEVKGAKNEADAEKAAFSVANSNLVKTAIYGHDANWGRIMCALGYSDVDLKEEKIDIYFGKVKAVSKGLSTGREEAAEKVLKGENVKVIIDLKMGRSAVKVFTCDMSEEYIRINSAYRT
jgi:glutamate N-acetyltransferase/amino-acid N-acetyltransferase